MKLRTSFFNFRVLLKNLTRFAPLWVLYAVGEVLGLMSLDLGSKAANLANDLTYIMGTVAIFHMVYAALVAACLFGDLFDGRMCNGLHAMPMKREGWLITNLLSGLVFALIPAVVGGGVAMLFLEKYWWIALIWQGTSLLQFIFFFGLAVFCAMCTGKRIGMIAMYAILNFLSMLVFWIADSLYEPMLTGVVISDFWYAKLCPVVSLAGSMYLNFHYDSILGAFFQGFYSESFYYLYICAGIGVVFMLLAWLLYRKRALETAGDFISFRPMRIFFLLAYTLAVGVLLYSFGDDFLGMNEGYGFLVVGILIGWFTGWMLLERTAKIFNKKVLLSFAAFVILFVGSMGITMLDPLGIVTYIPETQEIAAANLYLQSDIYYYESDDGWAGWDITDPDEIAWVQDLHQSMLGTSENTGEAGKRTYFTDRLKSMFMVGPVDMEEEYITTNVRYRLKNGRDVYRTYRVPAKSETLEELRPFFSDLRSLLAVNDWEEVKSNMRDIVVYRHDKDGYNELFTDAQKEALFAAIEADSKAGTLVQHSCFHENENVVAGIDLTWDITYKLSDMGEISGTRGYHIVVFEDSINTLAFLETLPQT